MALYRKILVAVDLSAEASQVLGKAVAIAADHGATIDVVHVSELPIAAYGLMADYPTGAETLLQDEALEALCQMLAPLGIAAEQAHVLLGHPATAINDLAKKLQVDLLVIGTHGRHGIRLLLGSTANAVLHHVSCDALIVKIKES